MLINLSHYLLREVPWVKIILNVNLLIDINLANLGPF